MTAQGFVLVAVTASYADWFRSLSVLNNSNDLNICQLYDCVWVTFFSFSF